MTIADGEELAPGAKIGRFEIARRLGAGGMGVVYEARDPELERRVAVKLLHGGGESLRLLREAQALAQLQHPNVVVVHDVGVADGSLFLAMELVDGETLAEHLRARERSWREIVALFVQAGRGLAAAHGKSIVHRDFKPANAIIDRDGRVRVTDFGLARFTSDGAEVPAEVSRETTSAETVTSGDDDDDLGTVATPDLLGAAITGAGKIVGTPRYMSPEQRARGAATARSDQYAWCVALWEALFGVVPPARGKRRVPRWLVRALERGLAQDPADRFPSMNALLDRIDRAPRVRRAAWTAAGVAAIAGVGAWIATRGSPAIDPCGSIAPLDAWDARARADVQHAFDASGAPYGREVFATIAARLDDYATRWRSMRESSCRAPQSAALADARALCLERRRDEVAALVAQLRTADRSVVDKAVEAVGRVGDLATCEAGAAARVAPLPQDRARAEQIRAIERELAALDARLATGRIGDDDAKIADATARARATGYRPLAVAAAKTELALAVNHNAWPRAIEIDQRGLDDAEAAGDDEARFAFYTNLVEVQSFRMQAFDEAARAQRAAEALLARLGEDPARAARFHCAVALGQWSKGDWEPALASVKTCVAERERAVPRDDAATARALHLEAIVDDELGRVPDAAAAEQRAIELGTRALGARHPYVAKFDLSAGAIARELDKNDDAERLLKTAIEIISETQGETSDTATALMDLGILYMSEERYPDAVATMQRTVAIYEKTAIPDHEQLAHSLDILGEALARTGRFDEGEAAALRSLSLRAQAGLGDHPGTANAHRLLGKQYRYRKQWDKALAQYELSRQILVKKFGADSPELATTWIGIGDIDMDAGRPRDAIPFYERALALTEKPEAASHRSEVVDDLAKARAALDQTRAP